MFSTIPNHLKCFSKVEKTIHLEGDQKGKLLTKNLATAKELLHLVTILPSSSTMCMTYVTFEHQPWLRRRGQGHYHSTRKVEQLGPSGGQHWKPRAPHTQGPARQTSHSARHQPHAPHRKCRSQSHSHCCSHWCCVPWWW